MRYIDRLKTPHTELVSHGGLSQVPFKESGGFKLAQATYELSDKTFDDTLETAHALADVVRSTLRFTPHTTDRPSLGPENLEADQQTDCHGYSIVISEALSELHIPHVIGFANQHSFVLLRNSETHQVNMIDGPTRQLYIDISSALHSSTRARLGEDDSVSGYLRGDIIRDLSLFSDKETAFQQRPWMSFTIGREGSYRFKSEDERIRAHTLVMRTYTPDTGRQVLEVYENVKHAIRRDEIEAAYEMFGPLDGQYPDIDKRNELETPTRLVRALGVRGMIAEALSIVGMVEESLVDLGDLILQLWPSDERRHIGVSAGKPELIEEALSRYRYLHNARQEKGLSTHLVESRIIKAKKQLARIALHGVSLYPVDSK